MNPVHHRMPRQYQRFLFAGLSLSAVGLVAGLATGGCRRDEGKVPPAQGQAGSPAKREAGKASAAKGGQDAEAAKKARQPPPKGLLVVQDNSLRNQLATNVTTEYKGGRVRTNQWGMRDKDYQMTPPAGTRRIAVLGPSHVFGAGVNDGETFEQLVEDRLNREVSPRSGLKFEFLNFAVPNYSLMQQSIVLANGRVGEFQPDVVMIVSHLSELRTIADNMFRELQAGRSFPAPVDQMVRKAGVTAGMPQAEALKKLIPYSEDVAEWALAQAAAEIRRIGAEPLYAMIPLPAKRNANTQKESRLLLSFAQAAGFLTLDLLNVYKGTTGADIVKMALSANDRQPNAEGHRMIARGLFDGLTKMPAVLAADSPERAKKKATVRAEWNRELPARKKAAEANAAKLAKTAKPAAPAVPIEGWTVEAPDGGQANLESSRKDDWMRVSISRVPKSASSQVRLRKAPVPIVSGRPYVLSLWLKADSTRPVGCRVAKAAAPFGLLGPATELQVDTWWQEFSCSFTATGSDANAQIFLNLGNSNTALELSKIQLKDVSTGEVVMSTDPAWRRSARTPN